jgi:hypothetical protein
VRRFLYRDGPFASASANSPSRSREVVMPGWTFSGSFASEKVKSSYNLVPLLWISKAS